MKKIIISIMLCILIALTLCVISCGDKEPDGLKGTDISAPSFQWNGDIASMSASNSTEVFSFVDAITVADGASYTVTSDLSGNNEIPSKTVNLTVGDNTYYIIVKNGSEQKLYTFNIRRKPMYTVSFDTNGGEGVGSLTVTEGATINEQQTSKTGYTYEGWAVNGQKVNFPYTVNGDVTLSAIFTPIPYKIEYVLDGGINNSENPSTYTIEDTVYLKAPTKESHEFEGWYKDPNFKEAVFSISEGVSGKITLYAKWRFAYKIEYELNGGINSPDNLGYYIPEEEVVLYEPTRDGYEFLGWYTEKTFKNKIEKISGGSSGNKILYAKWEANENKLIFNSNGGTGIMPSETLYTDEEYDLPRNVFKKENHIFMGWSTTPKGDVEYRDQATYIMGPSREITLYAVWEEIAPVDTDITLFANGFTDYTIVYPKDNAIIESQVKELAQYLKTTYNIQIPYKAVDKDEDVGKKEIIVGDVRNKVKFSIEQMNASNDFVLDVSGDDYVIYAPNDALYSYALRIFRDEVISKTSNKSLTISSDYTFSYKDSEHKDVTYLNYLKAQAGSYNKDLLCVLFNGLSFTATDGTTLPYRLYVPSNYDESKDYPVIVFLHGAGERGDDNRNQMGNMLPAMFNQQNTKFGDAIVVAPQCPGWPNQWVDTPWADGNYSIDSVPESNELKAVVELLNTIKSKYSTDEDRYYAMGISMGGFGTWDLIMRHPEMFAAAVPVCGGADVSQAENLKYMPIFTAHADNDGSVPFSGTRDMVKALKRAGSTSVIFKQRADGSLSSGGHIIWDEIGGSSEMMDWLFNQAKDEGFEENGPVPGPNETPFIPWANHYTSHFKRWDVFFNNSCIVSSFVLKYIQ